MIQNALAIILILAMSTGIIVIGAEGLELISDRKLASILHFIYFVIIVLSVCGLIVFSIVK